MAIRFGKQLTQAREALGFVVDDVAHRTKIPAATIRHLESEDYSHFTNNVYAKGFLRLYCKFLKIDPRAYLDEKEGQLFTHEDEVAFLEGIAVSPEFQDLEEDEPERKSVSPGLVTTIALVVIGIPAAIFLSGLYRKGNDSKAKDTAAEESPAPAPAEGAPVIETPPLEPDEGSVVGSPGETPAPDVPEEIDPAAVPSADPVDPAATAPRASPVDPDAGEPAPAARPVASTVDPDDALSPPRALPVAPPNE